jgi:hypothetical protein
MTDTRIEETTPDQLMAPFRGRSLKSIIAFTVVVHLVVLGGTSVPFFLKTVRGEDGSKLTEDQRIDLAVREATASLREIADKHGLKAQDLGERFGSGAPKTEVAKVPASAPVEQPKEPKSAIEKELDTKEPGPALPDVKEEDNDLFK